MREGWAWGSQLRVLVVSLHQWPVWLSAHARPWAVYMHVPGTDCLTWLSLVSYVPTCPAKGLSQLQGACLSPCTSAIEHLSGVPLGTQAAGMLLLQRLAVHPYKPVLGVHPATQEVGKLPAAHVAAAATMVRKQLDPYHGSMPR